MMPNVIVNNNISAIKNEDYITPIELILLNDDNTAMDLTDREIIVRLKNDYGYLTEFPVTEIENKVKLIVRIPQEEATKIGSGIMYMEVVLDDTMTLPNDGFIQFRIVSNAKSMGDRVTTVTFDYFVSKFDVLGKDVTKIALEAAVLQQSTIDTANAAVDTANSIQAQFDRVVQASTIDPEVEAMAFGVDGTEYTSATERLRQEYIQTENYMNEITYSMSKFPRLSGETDDCDRFLRAVDTVPVGSKILIPTGQTTDFAGRTFPINKRITIENAAQPFYNSDTGEVEGDGVFQETIVRMLADYIKLIKIGVNTSMSDAFQANTNGVKGLRLISCVSKASAHCYLFESYNGEVFDVICEDCESHDSTHGFIAKANRIQYISCRAFDHTTNGFGWISDNIPGVDKPAINKDGLGEGCYAKNCQSGYTTYSRDYFSTNNANGITLTTLTLSNCTAENCQFGASIGDPNSAPSGQTYNEVMDITINGFKEIAGINSVYSFRFLKSRRVKVISPTIEKVPFYDRTLAKDYIFDFPSSKTGSLGNIEDIQSLDVNSATPTLNYLGINNLFKTANTQTTAISGFLNSRKRGTVMILIDDDFTSILNTSSIALKRNRYEGKGSWVVLKYDNTKWNELYGFNANKRTIVRSLDSATGALEVDRSSLWEVQFSTDNTKTISLTGTVVDNPQVSILIRKTTTGTGTFGGIDASIGNAAAVPTSISFGTAVYVTLQYINSLSKWFVVDTKNIPY